eukprot:jgi/Mesvir1/7228/Mv19045-RA.1
MAQPLTAPWYPVASFGTSVRGPRAGASRTGGQPWWLVGDALSVDGRRSMSTVHKPNDGAGSNELLSDPVVSSSASAGTPGETFADQVLASVADAAAACAPFGSEVAAIASQSNFFVAGIQQGIEAVHVSAGLPWWAAIVACTFAVRTAVLPLTVMQMKNAAAMTMMRPEMEALNNEMRDRIQSGDTAAGLEMRNKMLALWKKYKVNPIKSLATGLVQAPLFICFFLAVRRMCDGIPTFATGGPALYPDLSAADPLCILPVLAGASMLGMVEMGFTDGVDLTQPAMKNMKNFLRVVAVISVPLTYTLPSGVFLYWIANNSFSFVQTLGFKYLGLKKLFGIPQVLVPAGPGTTSAWPALNQPPPGATPQPGVVPPVRATTPLVLQALRAKQHKHGQKKS